MTGRENRFAQDGSEDKIKKDKDFLNDETRMANNEKMTNEQNLKSQISNLKMTSQNAKLENSNLKSQIFCSCCDISKLL